MKANPLPLVLFLACTGLFAAAEAPGPEFKFAWVDSTDPTTSAIRRAGEQAIDHVAKSLWAEVQNVLAANEPAFAVAKLHLKNYQLPAAAPGQPVVSGLRRTSLRLRNPMNAPDPADQAALDLIKQKLEEGDAPPKVLLQKLESPGRPVEWRVYRPLGAAQQCLVCHGALESIDPSVRSALKQFFPEDQAVGYSTGEWRGVVRVTVSPGEPAAPVKPSKP